MHLLIAAAPTPHLMWHYSSGAINDDFCSVDWGRNIGPVSLSPPRGIWQLKCPLPRKFASKTKNADAHGLAWGWGAVNRLVHRRRKPPLQ